MEKGVLRVEDLQKLSMEQLRMVKSQVDEEVDTLRESLANLKTAISRLESASKSVEAMSKAQPGQEILVPLTGSLFVPGTLASSRTLLVDIGAAYYVEKSTAEAEKYCERKIAMLKENHERVVQVLAQKSAIAEEVSAAVQAKMRALLSQRV